MTTLCGLFIVNFSLQNGLKSAKFFFTGFINDMLTINQYKQNNLNFTAYTHDITNKAGKVVNRGTTTLLRHDLDFDKLVLFLAEKYQDVKKVNVINHACSNGAETYSFIAILLHLFGKTKIPKKFTPVIAKDKVQEHIDKATEGKFEIGSVESAYINYFFPQRAYRNYFKQNRKNLEKSILTIKERIKKMAIFERGNILKDVQKIDFHNTVLFARNFWPYLKPKDRVRLAQILSERMDSTSTLIIGNFDKNKANVNKLLEENGFVESKDIENVFEKGILRTQIDAVL